MSSSLEEYPYWLSLYHLLPSNNVDLVIGMDEDGSSYGYQGYLDEIAIYNKSFSPEQISEAKIES